MNLNKIEYKWEDYAPAIFQSFQISQSVLFDAKYLKNKFYQKHFF